MNLNTNQIAAIDARVDARLDELIKIGRFSALGTVIDYVPGEYTAMVVIDGSNQAVRVKVYQSCEPRNEYRVGLLKVYGYWHVIATYAHTWPSEARYNDAAADGTTASGAYSATPGGESVTFTKHYSSTSIHIEVNASLFITVSSLTGAWWGARVVGTTVDGAAVDEEYNVVHHQFNASSQSHHFGGWVAAPGVDVPAGSYVISLRWRRGTGTGTLNQNTADWVSMLAREVSP